MKQLALIVILTLASIVCFASIDEYYSFNATTGTYSSITGTSIDSITDDDVISPAIPIGFSFPYGEASFTELKVSSNGWIGLGTTFSDSNLTNQLNSDFWRPIIAPLWDDTSLEGGTAEFLLSGTAPNRIFTIQYNALRWNYSADAFFNIQVKLYETGKISFHYGSGTGTPNLPGASIGINMAPGGANWFYSVTPGTPASVSQTVENTSVSVFPGNGVVYEFLPITQSNNDLAATNITGNLTPSINSASVYTVTVRNRGVNPQSTYQVKLVTSTGTELASVNGTIIQPNQSLTFQLSWTPSAEGPLVLRGKVVLAGDQNPNNDLSNPLNVTVMPAGMSVITIGDGSEQAAIPVNMYWRNSLFETMYYPTEVTMVGNISALSFYNNFVTNLPNMPTKIWLGTTQQADLSTGWIPSTQLTLVFDGTVSYPSGQNTILIPLQTVYTYTGGNLVMMVSRPMDTQYYNFQDYFYCQTSGTARSRNVFSDSITFDPASPPVDAANSGQFPKTSIHISPLGTDPITIISPTSVAYGQVLINNTVSRQISIINGGGGTLTISNIAASGSPFFTIQNPPATPVNLTTGQSIQFNVVYHPTAAGNHTATISVTDNLARVVHSVPLTGTCIDNVIYTLPYVQNFDAVTAPALPIQWSAITQSVNVGAYVRTTSGSNYNPPNSVQMYNAFDTEATLLLIAPPCTGTIQMNTTRTHFRARSESVGATLVVGIMSNPQNAESFTAVQTVTLTNAWTEYVVSFASYAGAGHNIAFKHGDSGTYVSIYVDEVMLEVVPQNDLAVVSIAGNSTPSVNTPATYTANVYNWGTAPQSTYTVKLYNAANVELASANGTTVNAGQTVQIPLVWTPTAQGVVQLHAKVILTGDQNPINDASPAIPVTVMPEGMYVATIGTGTELSRMPVDMFYQNSLFETMFFPQEIGAFGTITAISFYNSFQTDLPNKPTKIWLGTTQQADLSAGWIASPQLTAVFNGNVSYPSGTNTITITLQTPFVYAGGNLVMMVNRPMDTTYFSSQDTFFSTTGTVPRTRNLWSDWTEFFPETPQETTPIMQFPNTSLHMTPLGPDPIFSITPGSKNFGTVLLNSTHNQVFTIMNAGGSPLTINTIGIAGSPFYSLQNMPTLPVSLNTGQTVTFTGRYHPTAVGTHSATITVNDHLRVALRSRDDNSRTPHAVELTGTCIDPTITSLPYLQNFDSVTAPALPVQWTTIIQGISSSTIITSTAEVVSAPNSLFMNNSLDANATLILVAPPYASTIATNTTRVKFKATAPNTYPLIVGVMTDPQDPATFTEVQTVTLSESWVEYVVTMGAYTGTGHSIAFKRGLGNPGPLWIDDIMLEVIPQNDLAGIALTGNVTPSVGMATSYVASVFNWGSNPQSTYQVKLYKQDGTELSTAPGTQVNPGQTVQVTVPWTPSVQENINIYAKVVLTGDQNNLNDQSPSMAVFVQPAGVTVLTIGDGSSSGRVPVDMYYKNSLFECIYYAPELSNTIGSILDVTFYSNFVTDLPNMPTNVWLGTTNLADLSAGWIPSTQLTQVFSGTVNYPSGQQIIHIPLPTPFLYLDGQNLVLMVERPMDTVYYSSQDVFQGQSLAQQRARNVYSDGTDFDPASPPDGSASTFFPKTSFFIIPGGVGHLNGTVVGAGNQPLSGVTITSTGGYAATTDANGHFSIMNIIAGTYGFSFAHHGYITYTQQIVIPEDETITQNITMQQMAMVTVSGTIIGSDTSAGLNGAGIFLQGYENYTSNTNAQGVFTIPGVYGSNEYAYTIICPGYQNHAGTINVASTNYSLGTITLNEVAYAPRLLHGEIVANNSQVDLSWMAPDPTALDVVESFESDTFPPLTWTQVVTNAGAPTSGVYPTWCSFNSVSINGDEVVPTNGTKQAGLWWSYEHQDEWLITPSFNCPPSAYLNFDSYVFYGSVNGDHYYVKISTDNGATWNVLWDASTLMGGWNYYTSPINIDLSIYEGMQLKIAWHADDPVTNDGLWYVWFIDDVYIGNAITSVRFSTDQLDRISAAGISTHGSGIAAPPRNSKAPVFTVPQPSLPVLNVAGSRTRGAATRALTGYYLWRLQAGQETDQTSWVPLNTQPVTMLNLSDTAWAGLANGNYRWAVKAVYTAGVLSVPGFSNILQKQVINGSISGVVRNQANNTPIAGASVSAGSFSATTNSVGAYNIQLPIGVYNVSVTKTGFISQTINDITVSANQATTVNFYLTAGSANPDDVVPITATALNGNYPNPFNPETTISFALKDPANVSLRIYNTKGQLVRTLCNKDFPRGYHNIAWDAKDNGGNPVGSGVYFYRMQAGSYLSTRKMLLME
jgi:hypothetical protein